MNKTKILTALLLLTAIASLIVTATAQPTTTPADNNPFSFHWWYKYQHQKVFDNDDNDKKHSDNGHKKKASNHKDNERLDKRYCAGSGFWDGHRCVIDDPVEKAAYEDAVCDDPKDTDKYAKICGGSYAVEEKPKEKQKHEDTTNIVTVKPFSESNEKPTIDPPGYAESKFSQDIADDDPTTSEYKEKVLKFWSERSPEESKAASEPNDFPSTNDDDDDNSRSNSDDDNNDDSNTIKFDFSDDQPDSNDNNDNDNNNDGDDSNNDDNDDSDDDSDSDSDNEEDNGDKGSSD